MASEQITVAGEYRMFVGTEASELPTDSTTALDATFKDVGLTTRDGSSFEDAPEYQRVMSHQSPYPTRTFRKTRVGTVMAGLQEWNGDNFTSAFGGGTITEPDPTNAPGEFRYDPPSGSGVDTVPVVLEMIDGDKNYRIIVPTTQAESSTTLPFSPDAETVLPVELAVIGDGTSQPWYMLTNDPAFNPGP